MILKILSNKLKKSFTLVEVLISTSILSLGMLLIFGTFLNILSCFNNYSNYLYILSWIEEKVWEIQNELLHNNAPLLINEEVFINNKKFNWKVEHNPIDVENNIYNLHFVVSWQEDSKQSSISRNIYVILKNKI